MNRKMVRIITIAIVALLLFSMIAPMLMPY